ncbi:MAG: right-handed parallel beta-helix repeat-containing protein [Flavobacteriales bacterium]|nr:right-handed parallel beta-helix repeat-containing protein [Flavobacteriales bacterium]
MVFENCNVYGTVGQFYEQAENLRDSLFDLVFRYTNFFEEDDQWSYIRWFATSDTSCTAGPHMFRFTEERAARVTFDHCGFYTNCRAKVRFIGRSANKADLPYCITCQDCDEPENCGPNSCQTSGPCLGCTQQDDRYVRILNCEFINTGRYGCGNLTEVISGEYVTLDSLRITVPDAVRDGIPGAQYATSSIFGNPSMSPGPPCGSFCTDYTVTYSSEPFPACNPLYADTVAHWAFCNPSAGNIQITPCGSYTLSKTATPTETQPDSTVTFTIAVCNNTVFATPVVLSEQLPPSFTVTSASIWSGVDTTLWSTAETTLTLNNGQCAQFMITGYFTAFGEFTNTVTLDTDTAQAGAELTDSATVSVVSACAADIIIPDSSLASVVGTVFSGTVNIQGLFTVDDDVLFQSAQVFMEAGAEIVVLPGFTLDIISSSVESCLDVMWKGITAQGGSLVRMRGSFVDDAENVVTALDGSTLVVRDNQFHNNRTTIHVPVVEGVPWNDVAIYALGNTFYSQGDMPQPYPGQATAVGAVGFAAFDVNFMVLDLTDGNNIIHHMSNGIVAHHSDVRVLDCRMLAIQPDVAYAYTGNGAGIYAYGGKGWNTLEQEGYGMGYTPSFENCRWGIYTEYMNVYSTDNNMVDMGTAYRIMRSGDHEVDILNNRVHTKYHGMDLRFNDGAMHVLVEGNEITFGDTPCAPPAICRPFSAIVVTEGSMANTSSVIRNNTIQYVGSASSRYGINLMSADDWLVAQNTLDMADNALNETGVWLQGCRRAEVSCNTVAGASTSYPLKGQAAIRNMMGNDPLISCNDVDMTTNGIIFNGVAPNTVVQGNHIRNHKWGLHLDGTAVIGGQELKGNLWYNAAGAGGICALYEDTVNAPNNQFRVNPSGGNPMPPSVWPTFGWFIPWTLGPNYDCADDEGEDYCDQFHERGKENLTELDVRVATDSLENDPYTAETKWMLEGRLYKKLDENPELHDSLQAMADLYEELQGSSTAAFKMIDDEQLHLYDLDSTVVAQLQAHRAQIDSLLALVQDGLEQTGDSTLTFVQRQAVLDGINGYRDSIRDLSAWNATVLQAASALKISAADGVQASNGAVYTSELIEENQKEVNEIYLATVGKDVDTFTSGQAATLFDIANQCPMLGGNAVFKARALFWLIDDSYGFDDQLLCLPYGVIVKSLFDQHVNALNVVPNPASDEASLILVHETAEPAYLTLYNAVGSESLRVLVPKGTVSHAFSTACMATGLYHYQLLSGDGLVGHGKLTIVR